MTLACLLTVRSFVGAAGAFADAGAAVLTDVTFAAFIGVQGAAFERLDAVADRDAGLRD